MLKDSWEDDCKHVNSFNSRLRHPLSCKKRLLSGQNYGRRGAKPQPLARRGDPLVGGVHGGVDPSSGVVEHRTDVLARHAKIVGGAPHVCGDIDPPLVTEVCQALAIYLQVKDIELPTSRSRTEDSM